MRDEGGVLMHSPWPRLADMPRECAVSWVVIGGALAVGACARRPHKNADQTLREQAAGTSGCPGCRGVARGPAPYLGRCCDRVCIGGDSGTQQRSPRSHRERTALTAHPFPSGRLASRCAGPEAQA
eukprot:352550-Chlamydomonas_euryale.AAC.12